MLRIIATFCFATCLALSSVTMAVARASAAPSGGGLVELVLCSSGGETRFFLDARGQPVEPHHHCPDCVAGMAVDLVAAADLSAWVALAQTLRFHDAPAAANPFRALPTLARGPPAAV